MRGNIPIGIGNISSLVTLSLGYNELSGSIPTLVGRLWNLQALYLNGNKLQGYIPYELFQLDNLVYLSLGGNQLCGSIPSCLGNLAGSLRNLALESNSLSSTIPYTLWRLAYILHVNLSSNSLIGALSQDIGNLTVVLEVRRRNSNWWSVPKLLCSIICLKQALCGAARLHVPPCKNGTLEPNWRKAKYIILGIISVILLVASVFILVLRRKRNVEVAREANSLPQLLWRRISHLELLRATNGLNENNLLGSGGFGSVYKGTLSDGIDVAVKVFSLQLEGAFKSFDRECEMLRNIRHRNLIKIISCCSEIDFKALVLNYMPNGSLEKWLYSQNYSLNILQRMNIMIDVASALEYLHHGYLVPIVHCDIKPSNILLDDDMVAHVADFGIAKLLGGGGSITQTMTLATVGVWIGRNGFNKRGCVQFWNFSDGNIHKKEANI
ncbi:putative LRR receptor-like serine/threonine-protein kinase [Prunus yedoensis var. nudiflora]|uniref:Putative LRR receptor-like serine/threonine-protein kinase n=1 Tax=Prunus yedoensis var. nudiflora TaxID=2094558 RepID=A0A314YMA5_PRUYE|nr:putative LRR receptor-like serine/threonine-protein kinase [Prunus yedoensis var. nudiflora]